MYSLDKQEILQDYRLACISRQASLLGRKEVFMGKAKFGIFGDGKEVAQLAMAKVFQKGDFRAGYYRDQTFMLAIGEMTVQQYFAQLYAHASIEADPASGGRMMNSHFATRMLDTAGNWKKLIALRNISADLSSNGAQMPRLVGLAYASKLFRNNPELAYLTEFSQQGNEIAFGTIGNAATSEGMFFEAINAAGVLQIPMLVSVWDDEYGISVSKEYHTTKYSISTALAGFQRTKEQSGLEILTAKGWDYQGLCQVYQQAAELCRQSHIPVLIHVQDMTQPQGHSTSGSHERYKSTERLAWEATYDCNKQMRTWILENKLATESELVCIEQEAQVYVKQEKDVAWNTFQTAVKQDYTQAIQLLHAVASHNPKYPALKTLIDHVSDISYPTKLHAIKAVKQALYICSDMEYMAKKPLIVWLKQREKAIQQDFSTHLYSESMQSPLQVAIIPAEIDTYSPWVDGREVLRACFDAALKREPRLFFIGEDVGKIGDVNQGLAGLQ